MPKEIAHHFYDIHDNKKQKVSPELFDEIVSLIENGRKKGGVLVHCFAGVSRSSTFVISYIMKN
jgi:protein-tyrosine phosphatase